MGQDHATEKLSGTWYRLSICSPGAQKFFALRRFLRYCKYILVLRRTSGTGTRVLKESHLFPPLRIPCLTKTIIRSISFSRANLSAQHGRYSAINLQKYIHIYISPGTLGSLSPPLGNLQPCINQLRLHSPSRYHTAPYHTHSTGTNTNTLALPAWSHSISSIVLCMTTGHYPYFLQGKPPCCILGNQSLTPIMPVPRTAISEKGRLCCFPPRQQNQVKREKEKKRPFTPSRGASEAEIL